MAIRICRSTRTGRPFAAENHQLSTTVPLCAPDNVVVWTSSTAGTSWCFPTTTNVLPTTRIATCAVVFPCTAVLVPSQVHAVPLPASGESGSTTALAGQLKVATFVMESVPKSHDCELRLASCVRLVALGQKSYSSQCATL